MNIGINITLVIVLVILACMAVKGYKNGLVQEVVMILALGVTILALALLASAIGNYLEKRFTDMVIAILFFVVLMIVANISKLIVVPVKFLSKLPIINWINKIMGMCLGLAKGIICLWIFFLVLNVFSFFGIRNYVISNVESNAFLSFFYQNNYLAKFF